MENKPVFARAKTVVQQRLWEEGVELPARLHRLAHLPWLNCYTNQLRTEGKSQNTMKSYLSGLKMMIETPLAGEEILNIDMRDKMTVAELAERMEPLNGRLDIWMHSMAELRPTTVNARMAAARHLINWLGHRWPEHLVRPSSGKRLPRTLTKRELSLVVQAAKQSENPVSCLVVTLLLETGMRVSEVCRLDMSDIDLVDRSARVFGGKGNKDRLVLFTDQSLERMREWLPIRESRKPVEDAVLVSKKGERLSSRAIQRLMDELADEAGIPRGRLTPHVLRHNFATGLLERGADLVTIQRLLGHATIATTRVYLEISDQTLREVYKRAQSLRDSLD